VTEGPRRRTKHLPARKKSRPEEFDRHTLSVDRTRLDGALAVKLMEPAVTAGGIAMATVLIAPGDEETVACVRAWSGIAVARICAKDGATLRRDLIAVLTAL
jgi:urease accessory protein